MSLLVIPRRDYEAVNRNYNPENVIFEITNPMTYCSMKYIKMNEQFMLIKALKILKSKEIQYKTYL